MDRLHSEYVEASRFLYNRINYEKSNDRPYNHQNYRLARMEKLMLQVGSPQLDVPVIHVAGTKGKGSVCWQIAGILERAGYKVGLFTSPHLEFLEERFVINGHIADPQDVVDAVAQLKEGLANWDEATLGTPTFFELTTAIAWLIFKKHRTQVNVVEVGMGGRLDSTNVCQSLLSVITPISFDHVEQLGNTIELIAAEKAGIIKPNSHVICGANHPDAKKVIRRVAEELNCDLWMVDEDFHVEASVAQVCAVEVCGVEPTASESVANQGETSGKELLNIDMAQQVVRPFYDFVASSPASKELSAGWRVNERSDEENRMIGAWSEASISNQFPKSGLKSIPRFQVRMLGRHQAENASISIAVAQKLVSLGWKISEEDIRKTLAHTQVPSRIEILNESPMVILDAAHNVASMTALVSSIQESVKPSRLTFVFASSKDKDYSAMLDIMMPVADGIILTQFGTNPRHLQLEALERAAEERRDMYPDLKLYSAPTIQDAARFALKQSDCFTRTCDNASHLEALEVASGIGRIDCAEKMIGHELDRGCEAYVNRSQGKQISRELICFTGSFFITTEVREALAKLMKHDVEVL